MSDQLIANRPSLTNMAHELLGFIIPDPARTDWLNKPLQSRDWLNFRHGQSLSSTSSGHQGLAEAMATIRAVSQTCRSLRAFTLPLLWQVVYADTVQQLATLHEILSERPFLASFIRHFAFNWHMNGDAWKLEAYGEQHGTLLDMAFIDRGALWEEKLQASSGAHLTSIFDNFETDYEGSSFVHDGKVYFEPGHRRAYEVHVIYSESEDSESENEVEADDDTGSDDEAADAKPMQEFRKMDRKPSREVEFVVHERFSDSNGKSFCTYAGRHIDRSGPDGNGQNSLIRCPLELITSITQVSELCAPSVESFAWLCPVMPMPQRVFEALKSTTSLKALEYSFESHRDVCHALPLWELTSGLVDLSVRNVQEGGTGYALAWLSPDYYEYQYQYCWEPGMEVHDTDIDYEVIEEELMLPHHQDDARWLITEALEEQITSFELPSQPNTDTKASRRALHYSIASRMVVAAATSGQLKRLELYYSSVQKPFAVRSLLPCWVKLEAVYLHPEYLKPQGKYIDMPVLLRLALAHASTWHGTQPSGELSGQDVRALHTRFQAELETLDEERRANRATNTIELYLSWLHQDAELSQRVADAWNSIVERGEANVAKCSCEQCKSLA